MENITRVKEMSFQRKLVRERRMVGRGGEIHREGCRADKTGSGC